MLEKIREILRKHKYDYVRSITSIISINVLTKYRFALPQKKKEKEKNLWIEYRTTNKHEDSKIKSELPRSKKSTFVETSEDNDITNTTIDDTVEWSNHNIIRVSNYYGEDNWTSSLFDWRIEECLIEYHQRYHDASRNNTVIQDGLWIESGKLKNAAGVTQYERDLSSCVWKGLHGALCHVLRRIRWILRNQLVELCRWQRAQSTCGNKSYRHRNSLYTRFSLPFLLLLLRRLSIFFLFFLFFSRKKITD